MKLRPITLDDLMIVKDWRNDQRESLRTGGLTTEYQQRSFFMRLQEDPAIRYWAIEDNGKLVGAGGFTGIQWGNRLAELCYIAPKMRQEALYLILEEGFDRMGLENIWFEYYDCNRDFAFWEGVMDDCYFGKLPKRKFWNGTFHDSTYCQITKKLWENTRCIKSCI